MLINCLLIHRKLCGRSNNISWVGQVMYVVFLWMAIWQSARQLQLTRGHRLRSRAGLGPSKEAGSRTSDTSPAVHCTNILRVPIPLREPHIHIIHRVSYNNIVEIGHGFKVSTESQQTYSISTENCSYLCVLLGSEL